MADEWKRETPWSQGHLLPSAALALLGISEPGVFAVVISHDCDLANENLAVEPEVEVLLGRQGDPQKSGNFRWGKSPRQIHLNFTHPENEALLLEFSIHPRKTVSKTELCKYDPQRYVLSSAELESFARWLASRYRRSAFPDAFNDVLKSSKLGDKLDDKLKGSGGTAVTAILFDVEEKSSNGFHLSVVLMYRDEDRYEVVEGVSDSISKLFDSLGNEVSSNGTKIVLNDCLCISEGAITLKSFRKLQKWEKDYLSLRSEPTGEMLGEV